jgi:hypothetical protein
MSAGHRERELRRRPQVPAAPPVAVLSINGWAALSNVAREIGRHPRTLRRWADKGLIKIKKFGGIYYVRPEQFEKVAL